VIKVVGISDNACLPQSLKVPLFLVKWSFEAFPYAKPEKAGISAYLFFAVFFS
jgi:hypothetical protein